MAPRVNKLLVFLALICIPVSEGQNSTVNLIVEGGLSLVGPHCPGTARLFCEGMNLAFLRWRYNRNIEIETFLPDVMATTPIPLNQNPAFSTVELTRVSQDVDRPSFGNFSSILTVELSQLEEQNVTDITCGDSGTFQTVPVNVSILQQSVPDTPNITEVMATYQSDVLSSVQVSWMKVVVVCPDVEFSLFYEVILTGSDMMIVNQTSCGQSSCQIMFTDFSSDHQKYELTLLARNNIGRGDLVRYPTRIGRSSQSYLTTSLDSYDCQSSVQCELVGSLDTRSMCAVQYTNDSMYRNLSDIIQIKTTSQLPRLAPDSNFYFIFFVVVNDTLEVIAQEELSTGSNPPKLTTVNLIMVVIAAVCVTLTIPLVLVLLIISCTKRWRSWFGIVCGTAHLLILSVCFALLIAARIIVGSQTDTCEQEWQALRDGLLLSTLILSSLGFVVIILVWIIVIIRSVINSRRVRSKQINHDVTNDGGSSDPPQPKSFLALAYGYVYALIWQVNEVSGTPAADMEQRSSTAGPPQPTNSENSDQSEYDEVSVEDLTATSQEAEPNPVQSNTSWLWDWFPLWSKGASPQDTPDSVSCSDLTTVRKKKKGRKLRAKRKASKRDSETVMIEEDMCEMKQSSYTSIKESSVDPIGAGIYDITRYSEKPKPVPNVEDPNYGHLRQDESSSDEENGWLRSMHDDKPAPAQRGYNEENLQPESSIEPRPIGAEIYDVTRAGEKSKPVVNMKDQNYGHLKTSDRK